jgi:hypothetical protein
VRELENSGILLIGIAAGRSRGFLSEPTPEQSVGGKSWVRLCVILQSDFFCGLENNWIKLSVTIFIVSDDGAGLIGVHISATPSGRCENLTIWKYMFIRGKWCTSLPLCLRFAVLEN